MSPVTLRLPRCGHNNVDHFLCEKPALIRMACVNTVAIEGTVFVLAVCIMLSPLVFILVSYGHIVRAVFRIQSSSGRHRIFNTCGSHLTVVSLFYGNIIYMYMEPGSRSSQDQGKFLTLFYNILTPLPEPPDLHPQKQGGEGGTEKAAAGEQKGGQGVRPWTSRHPASGSAAVGPLLASEMWSRTGLSLQLSAS
ncbi:hypothetical protein GHT09_013167 [Marmota monax]|uniref:G-protein coupled receptors family 1 profile domain-containing protein n=1 Tax=Marmota monax TaxID=9995 RepID=A0A834QG14_MARMO|nr:hypothetical protein GHT09_013167 [Marmota monax]